MDDKKKNLIKCIVLLVVDLAIACLIARSRYLNFITPEGNISILHALSDGFSVVGILNLSFGALVKISATGFFDIFGFALRSFLNFFVPRSVLDHKDSYYEYKVKKAEKRKETLFFRNMIIIGAVFTVLGIIFTVLLYV